MTHSKGTTIISLLVAIAILGILSGIGIPSLQLFVVKLRIQREISAVNRFLLLARNQAISSGNIVTFCPLKNNKCTTNWSHSLAVFIDKNGNKSFDTSTDSLLQIKAPVKTGDALVYGKGRTAVKYLPTGRLDGWGSNGTFRYCVDHFEQLTKGIRVAVSGRIYSTTDIDHDGKDEDRYGRELSCL